jgi:hypothetical protein
MKIERLALQFLGAWIVLDALVSIAISTDQYDVFTLGRALRGLVGVLLIGGWLPKRFYPAAGAYLVLESIGSVIISPDKGILFFEIGWALRIIAGLLMVREGDKHKVARG